PISDSFGPYPIQRSAGACRIEGAHVRIAEGAVGGAVGGEGVGLQDTAVGGEDVDHGAGSALLPAGGGDDVSLRVQAHAVDPSVRIEVVEHLVGAQGVVLADGIGAQLALPVLTIFALRDVERLLVR